MEINFGLIFSRISCSLVSRKKGFLKSRRVSKSTVIYMDVSFNGNYSRELVWKNIASAEQLKRLHSNER